MCKDFNFRLNKLCRHLDPPPSSDRTTKLSPCTLRCRPTQKFCLQFVCLVLLVLSVHVFNFEKSCEDSIKFIESVENSMNIQTTKWCWRLFISESSWLMEIKKSIYTEKLFFLTESGLAISVVHSTFSNCFLIIRLGKNAMFPIIESWKPSNGPTWYKMPVIDNSVVFFGWFHRYRKPQRERRVFSLYSLFTFWLFYMTVLLRSWK